MVRADQQVAFGDTANRSHDVDGVGLQQRTSIEFDPCAVIRKDHKRRSHSFEQSFGGRIKCFGPRPYQRESATIFKAGQC